MTLPLIEWQSQGGKIAVREQSSAPNPFALRNGSPVPSPVQYEEARRTVSKGCLEGRCRAVPGEPQSSFVLRRRGGVAPSRSALLRRRGAFAPSRKNERVRGGAPLPNIAITQTDRPFESKLKDTSQPYRSAENSKRRWASSLVPCDLTV